MQDFVLIAVISKCNGYHIFLAKDCHNITLLFRDRTFYMANETFYKEIKPTKSNVPEASPRVEALSAHKNAQQNYQYDRGLPIDVSQNVSEATPRVQELAR